MSAMLSSRLDGLMNEMQQLRVEFRDRWQSLISEGGGLKESDTRIMNNLEDCVRSAEIVASVASTIVNSRSTIAGHSRLDSQVGPTFNDRTRLWVLNESGVRETQNGTTMMPPPTPDGSTSVAFTTVMLPPTPTQTSFSDIFAERAVSTSGAEATLNFFDDVESKLVEHWLGTGKQYLDLGNYSEAVENLKMALGRAKRKGGEGYKSIIEEGMNHLALCYRRLHQWADSEMVLMELYNDQTRSPMQVAETEHAVSHVCFNKGDMVSAEKWCRSALQKKARILKTREHESVYDSIYLLAEIFEAKSDYLNEEGYKALLPPEKLRKSTDGNTD